MIAAGKTGGVLRKGVRGFVAEAGLARVYCVKPPPGTESSSEEPAARIVVAAGGAGIAIGPVLNDGNIENAGVPVVVGAPSVGGPVNGTAAPPAKITLPWGMEPILATIWPLLGGFSTGCVVGA